MKAIWHTTDIVHGGTTLKDRQAPENGNMALHVCQDPVAVMENRRILAGQTLPLDHWALPWQKHTANSHRVTAAERGRGAADKDTGIMDVDAVWTTEPDTLIGVFTADCVGLLVADPQVPLVACIHSGWKGTAQAITLKTMRELISVGGLDPARAQAWFSPSILQDLKTMRELISVGGLDPARAQAWFSPSILQDSLEVGPEVIEAMEPLKELGLDVDAFWRRSEDPENWVWMWMPSGVVLRIRTVTGCIWTTRG